MRHCVYFAPGMFGFGRIGAFDYFTHLEEAIRGQLEQAGHEVDTFVVDVSPTASIRRRAGCLAELVHDTACEEGPIHLVGHSTGGLDARLVASPSAKLPGRTKPPSWLPRLRSVTTMNTPHYGTPLATFFATKSGQSVLYALSALTFIALTVGAPPMAIASALVVGLGRVDITLGVQIRAIERVTDRLLAILEPAQSQEVREYLEAIKFDQGAVIQLTPEAMDLFQAGVEDRAGVRYQSVVALAPAPTAGRVVKNALAPWRMVSQALFTALYGLTARYDERYPCAAPSLESEVERRLHRAFGRLPGVRANDGVVPVLSQIWGEVVWTGHADHLDVLGHFPDDTSPEALHVDWLTSGSAFTRRDFDAMTCAMAAGMLAAP